MDHRSLTEIHQVHDVDLVFANAAARTGYTAGADEIGRVAWQTDNDTVWFLADNSPLTWVDLSVQSSAGDTGEKGDTGVDGDTGTAGAKGDTGDQGDTGVKGDTGTGGSGSGNAMAFPYDWSTTTSAPPSSGEIRANSGVFGGISLVWVHDTDRDSGDHDDVFDYVPRIGDYLLINSESDADQYIFEITEITDSGAYHTFAVIPIISSGGFAGAEDITLTIVASGPVKYSDRLNQASHTDTTWYTVLTITPPEGLTLACDILVSGHSEDAATASWAYQLLAYIRHYSGTSTVTAGFNTPTVITEYDAAYDCQVVASGGDVLIQVRRNGGSDYDINWAVSVQAAYTHQ